MSNRCGRTRFCWPSAPNLYGFASRDWLQGLMNPEKIKSTNYFGGTKHKDADMVTFVEDELSDPSEEDQKKLVQAIAALSAEAQLNYQQEADEAATKDETIAAGKEILAEHSFNDSQSCADCHRLFGGEDPDAGAPDLTSYGSRQWLIDFISNPGKSRFYGDNNDRMPAFAMHGVDRAPASRSEAKNDKAATHNRIPSRRDLELLVDWLRRDWYEPTSKSAAAR
jgi:mono/diheme cytochrome c family protein